MPEGAWFAGLTATCGFPLPTHRAEHQAWCYAGHGASAMSTAARLKVPAYACLMLKMVGRKVGCKQTVAPQCPTCPTLARYVLGKGAAS